MKPIKPILKKILKDFKFFFTPKKDREFVVESSDMPSLIGMKCLNGQPKVGGKYIFAGDATPKKRKRGYRTIMPIKVKVLPHYKLLVYTRKDEITLNRIK